MAAGATLLAACDARELTGPGGRNPSAPRPDLAMPLGGAFLAPPPNSSPSAISSITAQTVVPSIPDSTWVVVTVEGQITQTWNSNCASAPPNWPCQTGSVAPLFGSEPWDGGPVRFWAGGGWGKLRGVGGSNGTSAIGLHFQTAAGPLTATLNLQAKWAWDPNFGNGPFSYYLGGGYNVGVTPIKSPIEIVDNGTIDTAGTHSYTVQTVAGLQFFNPLDWSWYWPAGAVEWYFIPGENVSEKPGFTGQFYTIPQCSHQLTCQYRPPGPGRMQATAYVETRYAAVRSSDGDEGQCEGGGLGGGGLGGGGLGDLIGVCQDDDGPKLLVACTSDHPTRGDVVHCTAQMDAGHQQPFTVTLRQARRHDAGTIADQISVSVAQGQAYDWFGPAVTSTNVLMEATLADGTRKRGSASFNVVPRGWTAWHLSQAPVEKIRVEAPQMTSPPQLDAEGHAVLGGFRLTIPPPEGWDVAAPDSGPNRGVWYFRTQMQFTASEVLLHPALFPPQYPSTDPRYTVDNRWYDDQDGGSGMCNAADVARFLAIARRHEGMTMAANSHFGKANEVFANERPQLKLEEMVRGDSAEKLRERAYNWLRNWIEEGAYHSVQKAFDTAEYPRIATEMGCKFDFNP
jgi:hypothetical protein